MRTYRRCLVPFFFFQAEDGIRDIGVTGVQTCALPIFEYDYAAMRGKVTRESIARGPKSLWRYKDLLPVAGTPRTGFHSGYTPLKKAERLGKELGCSDLWIKDDSCNYPTYSYKERVVSVAISKAAEFGFDTVGCASTGNLANSTAAHAAQAGKIGK